MARVQEMQRLTADLMASFGQRRTALGELRAGVQTRLANARASLASSAAARAEMAERLRGQLLEDRQLRHATTTAQQAVRAANRAAAASDLQDRLARDHANRQATVETTLAASRHVRTAQAEVQAAELAQDRGDRRERTFHFLASAGAARAAMAEEQRTALRQARAACQQEVSAGRAGTQEGLAQVTLAHQTMAVEQRRRLATDRLNLGRTMESMLSAMEANRQTDATAQAHALTLQRADLRTATADRLQSFTSERQALAAEQGEMGQVWAAFAQTMHERRAAIGVAPPPSLPEIAEALGVAPPIEFAPAVSSANAPAREPEATAAFAEPPRTEVAALADEGHGVPGAEAVFGYVADHPDGLRMTDLEEHFGTPRIQLARVLRRLMDENKVRKEDMLYFAT